MKKSLPLFSCPVIIVTLFSCHLTMEENMPRLQVSYCKVRVLRCLAGELCSPRGRYCLFHQMILNSLSSSFRYIQ